MTDIDLIEFFEKWIKTIDAQINTTKPIMAKDIALHQYTLSYHVALLKLS